MTYFKRLLPLATFLVCCSLFSFASVTYGYSGGILNKSSHTTTINISSIRGHFYTSSPSSGASCTPTNTNNSKSALTCILAPNATVAFSLSSTRGAINNNIQIIPAGGSPSGQTYISNHDNPARSLEMPKLCSGGANAVCISLAGQGYYMYVCDASDTSCPP